MADFDILKVKVKDRFFSIIEKDHPNIRNPIHDFLSKFYWHFLSISYRSRNIRLQSF